MFIYGENGAYDYMFAATISLLVVAYCADRGLVHLIRLSAAMAGFGAAQ